MDFPVEDTSQLLDSEDKKCVSADNSITPSTTTVTVNHKNQCEIDQLQIDHEVSPDVTLSGFMHPRFAEDSSEMKRSGKDHSIQISGSRENLSEAECENEYCTNAMPFYKLLHNRRFYKYILIVLMSRAAMALFPFYFKLGHVFGLTTNHVLYGFHLLSLVSIAWAISVNCLYEALTKRLRRKSISKPFLITIFILEATLFAFLIPLSNSGMGYVSLFVISFLIVILESQTALAVILAADMFGAKNSVAAFGLGCDLSGGPGNAIFRYIMSVVEQRFRVNKVSTPTSF